MRNLRLDPNPIMEVLNLNLNLIGANSRGLALGVQYITSKSAKVEHGISIQGVSDFISSQSICTENRHRGVLSTCLGLGVSQIDIVASTYNGNGN